MVTLAQTPNWNGIPSYNTAMVTTVFTDIDAGLLSAADYRFVFDVFVSGEYAGRFKVYPRTTLPVTQGMFDCQQLVHAYARDRFQKMRPSLISNFNDLAYRTNQYIEFELQIGEEYGGTLFLNQTGFTMRAYNVQLKAFQGWDMPVGDYVIRFLTDRDKNNVKMSYNLPLHIPFLNLETLPVETFYEDMAGTKYPAGSYPANLLEQMQFNVSVAFADTVGLDIAPEDTFYYRIEDDLGNLLDRLKISFNECRPKYPTHTLLFQNRLGGFENFDFTLATVLSDDFTRLKYQQKQTQYVIGSDDFLVGAPKALPFTQSAPGTDPISGLPYNKQMSGGVYNQTDIIYQTYEKYQLRLISDYVSPSDMDWLRGLVASPRVLLYDAPTNFYYPVTINEVRWSQSLEKMISLELNVTVAR